MVSGGCSHDITAMKSRRNSVEFIEVFSRYFCIMNGIYCSELFREVMARLVRESLALCRGMTKSVYVVDEALCLNYRGSALTYIDSISLGMLRSQ